MDDYFAKRKETYSPGHIASWIATSAMLANSQVFAQELNTNSLKIYQSENLSIELASCSLLHRPISEAATRGVMVERGLIDLDEADLGWIISQAISSEKKWHSGNILNLGKLLLYLPIASATGYIISEFKNEHNFVDIQSIPTITQLFMENSTPEDTVNLYTALYENQKVLDLSLIGTANSLHEGIEDLLEDDVNLLDFFEALKSTNIIFEEVSQNYHMSTTHGFSAFYETINEGKTFADAIVHTFVSLLSHRADSSIHDFYGRVAAYTIKQLAREAIEVGSIFTPEGIAAIKELKACIKRETPLAKPKTIGDLTTNVCFLATLAGIRP